MMALLDRLSAVFGDTLVTPPLCGIETRVDGMLIDVLPAVLHQIEALHITWMNKLWYPEYEFTVYCLSGMA
jgi:hypothetical protein